MLPSVHRLPKQEISQILRRGIHARGDAVELVYKKTSVSRFTFVVSTKIDKRATQRNRIRRILRESVWHVLPEIVPCDGVFIARKNIADLSQVEVEKLVVDVFTRANLLHHD